MLSTFLTNCMVSVTGRFNVMSTRTFQSYKIYPEIILSISAHPRSVLYDLLNSKRTDYLCERYEPWSPLLLCFLHSPLILYLCQTFFWIFFPNIEHFSKKFNSLANKKYSLKVPDSKVVYTNMIGYSIYLCTLKVKEMYEKCLRVSSSVKGKPLPAPPSGRQWATS